MINNLKIGESGILLTIGSNGFNLSANSNLKLSFTKPDNTVVEKTKLLSEVFLGVSDITVDDVTLLANEYVQYNIEVGFLDQYGEWCLILVYIDTDTSITQTFKGLDVKFPVDKECTCGA